MNKLGVILGAFVAVFLLGPASVLADTWGEPITVPGARFVILGSYQNLAVLKQETALVWERSPASSSTDWGDAHVVCNFKTLGNRMGWRFPRFRSWPVSSTPACRNRDRSCRRDIPSRTSTRREPRSTGRRPATPNSTAWFVSFHIGLVEVLPQISDNRTV